MNPISFGQLEIPCRGGHTHGPLHGDINLVLGEEPGFALSDFDRVWKLGEKQDDEHADADCDDTFDQEEP